MALSTATSALSRNPQMVGATFVGQYYQVLHTTPELVYKFYQESSILSRPDPYGDMSQVTTLHGINEEILSFKFNSYIAEIETVDSLASYKEGDKGYFVLNDIFRFVDQSLPAESNQILANGDRVDEPEAPLSAATEPSLIQENHLEESATPDLEGNLANNEDMANTSESCGSGVEDEVAADSPVQQNRSGDQPNLVAAISMVQDNGLKKSYASIVKVMGSTLSKKISAPAINANAKAASPSTQKPLNTSTNRAAASEHKAPMSNNGPVNGFPNAGGYSVHIRNLPSNTTMAQVEEELQKFGSIRPGGVQVRNHKVDNFCFGFVEFESISSMQAAIKASPIYIGRYPSYIEEKRTSTRAVDGGFNPSNNWRGRSSQARGGFRNDNFRGNANLRGDDGFRGRDGSVGGNNQGYGRTDFRNHGEYLGRGRGRGMPGNYRDGYQQRPIQNGNGRMARPIDVAA